MSVIQEFQNEDNIGGILGIEVLRHWYLVVLGVVLIMVLWYGSKLIFRYYGGKGRGYVSEKAGFEDTRFQSGTDLVGRG